MGKLKNILTDFKAAGWREDDEIKLTALSADVIAVARAPSSGSVSNNVESKIISLIKEKSFSERVQGKFEKSLTVEGKKELENLLNQGIVRVYKKKDYRQGVYVLNENALRAQPSAAPIQPDSNASESHFDVNHFSNDLEKNGFIVVNSDFQAKALSQRFAPDIQSGKITGLKDFEGRYYIARNDFLDEWKGKILSILKLKKEFNLMDLAARLRVDSAVVKTVIVFLKEDGDVIEKKKENYLLVA